MSKKNNEITTTIEALGQRASQLDVLASAVGTANTVVASNSVGTKEFAKAFEELEIVKQHVSYTNPSLTEGLDSRLSEWINSSSFARFQDIANSPGLSKMRELAESPGLMKMREIVASPRYIKMVENVKSMASSPAFQAARHIHNSKLFGLVSEVTNSIEALTSPPNIDSKLLRVASALSSKPETTPYEVQHLRRELAITSAELANKMLVSEVGKASLLKRLQKELGSLTLEEKTILGPELKALEDKITKEWKALENNARESIERERLLAERIDATLPAYPRPMGTIHPIMQVFEEVAVIFADMGFTVKEGPDIETDFNNFTALNFPEKHPARDMHDTFFFNANSDGERKLLRTHTSPVQIRTMLNEKPPIRIVAPGRTYRCDSDQTHTPMFHQIEGLVIEEGVHMGHLKGVLMEFLARFFEVEEAAVRFRPHHFPFTEPSAEVDVRCDRSGRELKIGTGEDWLEILGCGMVHPNVLRGCGIDPDVHQGFAFGMGIDRLAMLKYGIPDLRDMFNSDVRWLKHFGFEPMVSPNLASGLSR